MRWSIEIQKSSLERRNLADLLQTLGFELTEGISYPALISSTIDSCISAADVFEVAQGLRLALKDVTKIDPEFALGSVIDYSTAPPRRHAFLEAATCASATAVSTATATVSPPKNLSQAELERWNIEHEERQYQAKLERQRARLEPAYVNADAAKVIKLLAIEKPSADILYKIYELAEGHPKNRANFHGQFGVSRDQFARFKDAVHNPSVSGDWARHAYHDDPKTANPMTKGQAEEFVRNIAIKWLHSFR